MVEVFSMSRLAIRRNDVVIVTHPEGAVPDRDRAQSLANEIAETLKAHGYPDVAVWIIDETWKIESLNEDEMAERGWVRDPNWTPR